MDFKTCLIGRALLWDIRKPIRVPTACWLFSDLLDMRDNQVRSSLTELKNRGYITIDNGGWIRVK